MNSTRNRSVLNNCTHTSDRNMLYAWLSKTNYISIMPRICANMTTSTVSSSLNLQSEHDYQTMIHLGSYNYSGLSGHPEILDASQRALDKYGSSTTGVRLLNGTTDLHLQLEEALANFLGTEDAVIYSSGFSANIAVISALCCSSDLVFSDLLNHQSLIDGIMLSKAQMIKYRHADVDQLEKLMSRYPINQRKFIIVDGVFSMDGDICALDKMIDIAEKYNSFIIIDDAHAIAAIGECGRGTASHFGNVQDKVDVITGSLSKGIPGIGGYAAGPKETIDLLRYGSNGYIFSASLPAPTVAAILKALGILEKNPMIQEDLHRKEVKIRDGLASIGLDVMNSTTPIIPVYLGDKNLTFEFALRLHQEGIYVNPICSPAVGRKKSRLRINASAALTDSDIDQALTAFEKVGKELGVIKSLEVA